MRHGYQAFRSDYDRSGNNEPDPTKYPKADLPVLLMFWSFYDTPLDAWECRTVDAEIAIDDAGDGVTRGSRTKRGPKRSRLQAGKPSEDRIFTAAVYEALVGAVPEGFDEDERAKHAERVRRVGALMDRMIDDLEAARNKCDD